MIIDQLNVKHVAVLNPKDDAPVCPDGHGPETLQITFERVEAVSGKIKGLRYSCPIEAGQNVLDDIAQIGPYPTAVALLVEPFQSSMLEAPNH